MGGEAAETATGALEEGKRSNGATEPTASAAPAASAEKDQDTAKSAKPTMGVMSTGDARPAAEAADRAPPTGSSPKKRRKVNHACVYCRRSGRPCSRCIKRNIGHLCHDKPREPTKRVKNDTEGTVAAPSVADESTTTANNDLEGKGMSQTIDGRDTLDDPILPDTALSMQPPALNSSSQSAQPQDIAASGPNIDVGQQGLMGYNNEWRLGGQNSQFQDIHSFHPSYMFNAPEFTNEYNLLNDFLSTSLLDDGSMYPNDEVRGLYSDMSLLNSMATNLSRNNEGYPQQQQSSTISPSQFINPSQASQGGSIQRPNSTVGNDKAKETYYMTAADPSGTDPPEERMNKLLKAKYDAGLLKPFNYVNGYARLNKYMEEHLQPSSRQKILRQLDKFRPAFRERMHALTDIELVLVEMWFERSLMEYDRVFASMAIPACLWRRTGQIFRGNQEMAQLIDVPMDSLRDGKLAIHEIVVEDQLVSYWEKFGAIAFDSSQKAMLTSCTLKSPDPNSPKKNIPCCFSFTIRRDNHNIPSLIVGNFLPTKRIDVHR
ncbi:Zn cluster transcription factor Rds2 [Trichophyton equinum CBS 127.97]|uniref:Zn cluster transcription factor Rds2 n=1 Tax=Trichophyton equinum (strain ATCC MYA-4606 / CBS 127.97) TaxID=559882 RepID=F2Q4Q4_TRIEC|nr:Zn cluster transcription factor Rds2 [Trichophyton equinum CBS 127.97]